MPKNKSTDNFSQLSLLDMLTGVDGNFSSAEIEATIDKLRKAKQAAERREKLEQYRKEKREAERKAAEEKVKKEAHIREVTCMDLPLDWENAFNQLRVFTLTAFPTVSFTACLISGGLILNIFLQ